MHLFHPHWRLASSLTLAVFVCVSVAVADQTKTLPLVAAGEALPPPGARIVNGLETVTFPETVAVLFPSSICSGTVIDCDTVLTAAHCVCSSTGANCQAGGPDLQSPANVRVFAQHGGIWEVDEIVVHPNYQFGTGGDVAVLNLKSVNTVAPSADLSRELAGTGPPTSGIMPMPINTVASPPNGLAGQVAGFGVTAGANSDSGIKRWGWVTTNACSGVPDNNHVCWDFLNPLGPPGQDSSTCNGDSGGPLFTHNGVEVAVSGVTSGGNVSCLPPDHPFDTDVFKYRSFIQSAKSAADTRDRQGAGMCGDLPDVFSYFVPLVYYCDPVLSDGTPQVTCGPLTVPANTKALKVAINGEFSVDADIHVAYNRQPTVNDSDCAPFLNGPFEFCEFRQGSTPFSGDTQQSLAAPQAAAGVSPGEWWVLVDRFAGTTGKVQVTMTIFPDVDDIIFWDDLESSDTSWWTSTVP
jgi:hypothetical protein